MASKIPNQQLLKPPRTKMVYRRVFVGYLMLLTRQAMCDEFSQCYDDVNICLWTNGSPLTQSAAQRACRQRDNSFLPHITNSDIQNKMREFRLAAEDLLRTSAFWIDVRAVGVDGFHWIDTDSSPLQGLFCLMSTSKLVNSKM